MNLNPFMKEIFEYLNENGFASPNILRVRNGGWRLETHPIQKPTNICSVPIRETRADTVPTHEQVVTALQELLRFVFPSVQLIFIGDLPHELFEIDLREDDI